MEVFVIISGLLVGYYLFKKLNVTNK